MKKALSSALCMLLAAFTAAPAAATTPAATTPAASAAGKATVISREIGGIAISVEQYGEGILRVTKRPAAAVLPQKTSYSVIMKAAPTATSTVSAVIDEATGCLTFLTQQGDTLLSEKGTPTLLPRNDQANKGLLRIGQTWQLRGDEAIYGLGQLRRDNMSWRGQKVELWNHNTYIAIPYIASERGYGIYWDNAGKSQFEDTPQGMTFTSEVAPCIDYYFMYADGTQDGLISCIRRLTGQATMLPRWAMGHWQCRERYKTSDELAAVLDRYRELQIPLDGIVQDWQYWGCDSNWNAMRFMNPYYINKVGDEQWAKYLPDDLKPLAEEYKAKGMEPRLKSPKEMVDYVHRNDAHLMISIWANFGPWTDPYKELDKIGALLPFETWPRNHGVHPYDAFNPKARDVYWKHLSHLYDMGFDAWWTDSTEPDHFAKPGDDDYQTHDGSWLAVKNAFPLVHNRGIYDHQRKAELQKMKKQKGYKGKRSVQMTRSGSFGLQHYGTFSWSGDIMATWKEMKAQIPSGLNFSLCGIPFWNTDLGGFFYWDYEQTPKNPAVQELQTRWMQWGTFMPLMRNHCSSPMVSELYEFGQQGDWPYDAMLRFIHLRYRMLPYIYSLAGNATHHDGTLMRPFVMDFPQDRKAITLNDSYMFGPAMLVKPVTDPLYTWKEGKKGHQTYPDVKQAAAPVTIYLPKGTLWYDFWTGERFEGGREILRPCPIMEMPVYVKAGSIIPFAPFAQNSAEQQIDRMEIRIYPGADGSFALYEDEGDNYNYERGAYSEITFVWNDKARILTIGNRKGKFAGMLEKRTFNIVVCPKGDAIPSAFDKAVEYTGNELTVQL